MVTILLVIENDGFDAALPHFVAIAIRGISHD